MHYSIQHLPTSDRPRERLMRYGPESMSTAELIAIILGSGTKSMPVLQLAHEIISKFGSVKRLADTTIEELCEIKGLGQTKALQLKAALSLGMRVSRQASLPKYRIETPQHAYHLVKDELESEKREHFVTILLDAKGYVINHQVVSIGTLSKTLIHPREVFYPAIRHKASSMVIAHNHPSGDPTPSQEDYDVTRSLMEAGELLGISVRDHIIVGCDSYVSLRQRGIMESS